MSTELAAAGFIPPLPCEAQFLLPNRGSVIIRSAPTSQKVATDIPEPRKGQADVHLTREEFNRRFRQHFYDRAFDGLRNEVERLAAVAWDGYEFPPPCLYATVSSPAA